MALRVSFNNQMYKVPKLPTDLKAVTDVVSFLFGAELQQGWILEYLDPKDGPVALDDEDAYKKLQRMMWNSPKKPVKLNVRFAGDLDQNNQRRLGERSVPISTNLQETGTQATINDAVSTQATQSQQQISGDEQEEFSDNEEQTVTESNDTEVSTSVSRNKKKDKHRDLKQIKATLQKTLDKTKAQGVQEQSESAPMLTVALQLRKPKRNPGSSSGKSYSTGQNSKQVIREMHLQQKNIQNIMDEEEEDIDYEDESYADNTTTTADQKAKPLNQIYDAEIEEKVIRMYDVFPDADLKDLRRFVTPLHYLPIDTLIERFLTSQIGI